MREIILFFTRRLSKIILMFLVSKLYKLTFHIIYTMDRSELRDLNARERLCNDIVLADQKLEDFC